MVKRIGVLFLIVTFVLSLAAPAAAAGSRTPVDPGARLKIKAQQRALNRFGASAGAEAKLKARGVSEADIAKLAAAAKITGKSLDLLADEVKDGKVDAVILKHKLRPDHLKKIHERYAGKTETAVDQAAESKDVQDEDAGSDVDERTEDAIASAGADVQEPVTKLRQTGLSRENILRLIAAARIAGVPPAKLMNEVLEGKKWAQVIASHGVTRPQIEERVKMMKGLYRLSPEHKKEMIKARLARGIFFRVAALSKLTGKTPAEIIDRLKQGKKFETVAAELGATTAELKDIEAQAEEQEVEQEIEEEASDAQSVAPDESTPASTQEELKSEETSLKSNVAANPSNHLARVKLARVLGKLGKAEEAMAELRQVLDADPSNAMALMVMARRLKERGDLNGAKEQAEKLAMIRGEAAAVLALRAELREREGNLKDAIADMEKALSRDARAAHLKKKLSKLYAKAKSQGVQTEDLKVFVEGSKPNFDVRPFVENGRTLVPFRAIAESMGADVQWDGAARRVTLTKGARRVAMVLDSNVAEVDGQKVTLDVPAKIVGGRTVVPLRFVGEAMNAQVGWDGDSRMITVLEK